VWKVQGREPLIGGVPRRGKSLIDVTDLLAFLRG
jgi:hypothetical protein